MDILSRVPGLGSGDEDDGPEYEIIFSGSSEGHEAYAEEDDMSFNPHQMLGDTIGDIDIYSNNPYGPKKIEDEVSSVKALKLFDDTGEYVAKDNDGEFKVRYNLHRWEDGRVEYTMVVSSARTGIKPNHRPRIERNRATSFQGKLTEYVAEEEIERFVSQYGFDRHANGWKFDNLEGKLDEFLGPEEYGEVFEVPSSDVQDAVVSGEVRSAKYCGRDYSHWSDREIIGAVLGESLGSSEVRELEHSGLFNYEIFVEKDDLMDGDEIRLDVVSREPLFSEPGNQVESETDVENVEQIAEQ